MPKIDVLNQEGKNLHSLDLSEEVFGIEPNNQALFDAIVGQRASLRFGNHDVKNRSEVRGGGRKPWRQKGTGRARQGSIRSPQWRGGGTVFGPTPRSYAYKLPRKVRRLAIKSVLSAKAANDDIIVLDGLSFDAPRTKEFRAVLSNLDASKKALVVLEEGNDFAKLSARNIQGVKVVAPNNVSVLDVVSHDKLIFTKAALDK